MIRADLVERKLDVVRALAHADTPMHFETVHPVHVSEVLRDLCA